MVVICMGCMTPTNIASAAALDKLTPERELKLWYDEPAPTGNEDMSKWDGSKNIADDGWEKWSLPLGNGYMGVNVFGRTTTERLQITENSLAQPRINDRGGLNNFSETYIDFNHENPTNYSRDLVLNDGVSHVKYDCGGVTYNREYFTSYPDKVMVIRLTASQSGKVSFTLRPTIPYIREYQYEPGDLMGKSGTVTAAGDTITLSGVLEYYGVKFEGQYKVIPQGGTMTAGNDENNDNGSITVQNADSAIILVAVGTNYQLESKVFTGGRTQKLASNPHPHTKVTQMIADASAKSYDQLLAAHKADYQNLFSRVRVDFGGTIPQVTTDQLLNAYKEGTYNKYLEELYFQYGRYLLICSSRKGTLPPNLQGIWNRYDSSPWSAGYWHNINVQMNYWPVFCTNLSELFDCYIDYYEAYVPHVTDVAKNHIQSKHPDNYDPDGQNGWSIATGASPYGVGLPQGGGVDGYGTGALMAKSFYEYYDFTRNKELLEDKLYPAVLGAASFMSRIMEPYGDLLLATPSTSPEQTHAGQSNYRTIGTAWDQGNAYEMSKNAIELANVLGKQEDEIVQYLSGRYEKFDPVQVGYSGQIKEYREENYYGDIGEPRHRHISQLVGLYPGTLINSTTPAWLDAAKVTLNKRGDQSTGWAMAHRLNLWTRVKDGNRSYTLLQTLLKKGTLTNLWDTHPPFQIDGNLGGTSGIAEMLLQSHEGYIEPLPARSDAWGSGSYDGLLARGNFEVSAKWTNGQAEEFRILSKSGGRVSVKYYNVDNASVQTSGGTPVAYTVDGTDLISFDTNMGETYRITGIPNYTPTAAPSNLRSSTSADYRTVSLNWDVSNDASYYNVYRAVESSPTYELIASNIRGPAYTLSVSDDVRGRQTTYRVTAVGTSGRESTGITSIELPLAVPTPDHVRGIQMGTALQIAFQGVEAGGRSIDRYQIYKKADNAYQLIDTTEYGVAVVKDADFNAQYGVSAVVDVWESDIAPVKIMNYDNIFLNRTITSDRKALTAFPLSNTLDGNTKDTRMAVADQTGAYSITFDLVDVYGLGKLRIYEYKPDEGGTRSGETTIELYDGNAWKTIIDKQPLTPPKIYGGGEYTEFDMGGNIAQQVKITFNNTTGAAKSASICEITCSLSDIQPGTENILLNKSITSNRAASSNYPLKNALDGSLGTRYAVGDRAGPYAITIDIGETHVLSKLKIYEFSPGESATRSPETTIEIYDGASDTWSTVVDKQSLTPKPKSITEFNLSNTKGSKLRITFNNTNPNAATSASIYEIMCFAGTEKVADKTELLAAAKRASAINKDRLEQAMLSRYNTMMQNTAKLLNNMSASQNEIDTAKQELLDLVEEIEENTLDVYRDVTLVGPVSYYKDAAKITSLQEGEITVKGKLGNAGHRPVNVMVITAEYENIGSSKMMMQVLVKRVRLDPDAVVEFDNTIRIGQTTNREIRTLVMTDGLEAIGNVATLPGTS